MDPSYRNDMKTIVNLKETFSCGTHFQNRFTEPVYYETYVLLQQNVQIFRPV